MCNELWSPLASASPRDLATLAKTLGPVIPQLSCLPTQAQLTSTFKIRLSALLLPSEQCPSVYKARLLGNSELNNVTSI